MAMVQANIVQDEAQLEVPQPTSDDSDIEVGKPVVSMRLCIDNVPIPTETVDGVPGEWVNLMFTLERQSRWLSKCFGLKSLYKLPKNNVLQLISKAIRKTRGKRTTLMRKVSNDRNGQPDLLSITVRGYNLTVLNDFKTNAFRYDAPTGIGDVTWLVNQIWKDIHTSTDDDNAVAAVDCDDDAGGSGDDGSDTPITDKYTEEFLILKTKTDGLFWSPSRNAFIGTYHCGTVKQRKDFTIRYCKRVLGRLHEAAEMRLQRSRAEEFVETGKWSPIAETEDITSGPPPAVSLPVVRRSSSSTSQRLIKRSKFTRKSDDHE